MTASVLPLPQPDAQDQAADIRTLARIPTPPAADAEPVPVDRQPATQPASVRSLLAGDIAALADARTAHSGLTIGQVEELADRIVDTLSALFTQQIKEADLPLSVRAAASGGTIGDLPYRTGPRNTLLKVQGVFPRPQVRVETTPLVGIAQDRNAEHAYVVFDANVHGGAALFLTLEEVRSKDFAAPGGTIDRWVEDRLHNRLAQVIEATQRDVRGGA